MRLSSFIAFTAAPLLVPAAAVAQSARWEADDSIGSNGVRLVFSACKPEADVLLPAVDGVVLHLTNRSENTQTNSTTPGKITRSFVLHYRISGESSNRIAIPAFEVKTDQGPVTVPAFETHPLSAPQVGQTAKLTLQQPSVWAGEVVAVNYELSLPRKHNPQIAPTFTWNPLPLTAEDWSMPDVRQTTVDGERLLTVGFNTRVSARAAQSMTLPAVEHLITVQTGQASSEAFQKPRMEQVTVTSPRPKLEVRPLPPAPADFSGAVGEFIFTSKVVPETVAVGEPVTWTLQLTGTGNWPDIVALPEREASNDFELVLPPAKRVPKNGKVFDATLTHDAVLVPTKAGTYTLGAISYTWFDPQRGTYQTTTTPAATVTVTAAPPKPVPTPPSFPPGAPGTRKFGGPPNKGLTPAPADPALEQAEQRLVEIRRQDEPGKLFEMIRKAENADVKPTPPGKDR